MFSGRVAFLNALVAVILSTHKCSPNVLLYERSVLSQKTLVFETEAGVYKPLSFSSRFRNALCSLSRTPSHAIPLEHPGLCSDHDDLGHWTSAASYATMAPSNPPPLATLGGQQVGGWRRCRDRDISMPCTGRCSMRFGVVIAVMGGLLATATVATA